MADSRLVGQGLAGGPLEYQEGVPIMDMAKENTT